jgi:hypothetical protein
LIARLYPGWEVEEVEGAELGDGTNSPVGIAYAASFPGVDIVCDRRVVIGCPSRLPEHLIAVAAERKLILHAMHSVSDYLAFAVWEDGRFVRSLSLSPDGGIGENIGRRSMWP